MKREERYLIFKYKDLDNYCDPTVIDILQLIADQITRMRKAANKQVLKAVVVEDDWPEYETVWKLIEERVNSENSLS